MEFQMAPVSPHLFASLLKFYIAPFSFYYASLVVYMYNSKGQE